MLEAELAEAARDTGVIVVRWYVQITRRVSHEAKRLKLIQRLGTMTGNIDLVAPQDAGVRVAILPMALDMAVAEHVSCS